MAALVKTRSKKPDFGLKTDIRAKKNPKIHNFIAMDPIFSLRGQKLKSRSQM